MIEGLVAAVLNERQLAINRGADDGVTEGMVFAILAPGPVQITDPETNTPLGSEQQEKIRVRVVRVEPRHSVAQTFQTFGGRTGLLDWTDLYKSVPSQVRTLKTADAIFKPLPEGESYVKRGDRVRQIDED